jgi:hypothetical protein
MATTTPNFGWPVPTSTDLVKDGAVAIEGLGDAIDASLLDLKGGTTNQVLAKNSNTDMDFKWVADAAGMTNPMTTTGDTIYSSSGSTPARLGIGSTGQVLTVSGGIPSWASPAGGGKILQVVQATYSTTTNSTSSTFADTGLTASITPSSASSKVLVFFSITYRKNEGDAANRVGFKLFRGATDLGVQMLDMGYMNSATIMQGQMMMNYLDTPATTSATAYKVQFNRGGSAGTATVQIDGNTSVMILMEVGA